MKTVCQSPKTGNRHRSRWVSSSKCDGRDWIYPKQYQMQNQIDNLMKTRYQMRNEWRQVNKRRSQSMSTGKEEDYTSNYRMQS